MRKRILIVPAMLLMLAAPSLAGELWKKKSVDAWSRRETLEFLRNSPWARRVFVGPGTAKPDSPAFSRSPFDGPGLPASVCASCTDLKLPRESPTAAGSGIESSSGEGGRGGGLYFIQWSSARIVRQAISHLRALDGLVGEVGDVSVFPNYLLTVGGADLSAFDGITEAELKAATYLQAKGAEIPINPSRVTTQKQPDGRITSVHFEFPRAIKGQPGIAGQEKSVEFSCKLKDFKVRTTFNPSKMSTGDGRDL